MKLFPLCEGDPGSIIKDLQFPTTEANGQRMMENLIKDSDFVSHRCDMNSDLHTCI